jgi:hypothetical protein
MMKRKAILNRVTWILAGLAVVTGARLAPSAETDNKKGIVAFTEGDVKRQPPQVENWENAPIHTPVLSGDKVRTYMDSRAELDLAKLDIVRLAPKTIIDIVKLYEETKEKKVQTQIQIQQGEIWANVHQIEMNTQFDVGAPLTSAAITGTVFRMKVDSDSTTQLKVYHGEVRLYKPEQVQAPTQIGAPHQIEGPHQIEAPHAVGVNEWFAIVKSMQQITIDKTGKVVSTGAFTPQDDDEKTKWIQWNQARDKARTRRLENLKKQ